MLAVSLGFSCNNACVFCAQGELRAQNDTPDDAEALVSSAAPGEVVAFVGGEPTLAGSLPALIRAAHARGAARILLQTNARRLSYGGYAGALRAASSRLTLDVSLHGSTGPMHDYHTSAPGSFAQTVKGLAQARAAGIPFAVTTVVTRSNFRHLSEIVRLAGALGARAVQLAPAAPHGSAARARDRVIPAPELIAPHIAHASVEARAMGLGVVAAGRASDPSAAAWFAGLGDVEEASRAALASEPGARRVHLAVLGRPVPGRAEVRGQGRMTGTELRPLFPTLFEPDAGASAPADAPDLAKGAA